MKISTIICISAIIAVILLSGCEKGEIDGNVVDELPDDNGTGQDSVTVTEEQSSETEGLEGLTTQEMIDKLSEEQGLDTEDTSEEPADDANESEEENETSTSGNLREIVINDLAANPEDLVIKIGDTVKWTSQQKNYKHILIVFSLNDEDYRDQIAGPFELLYGDSAEHTFDREGMFQYWSKTCMMKANCKVNGQITVT